MPIGKAIALKACRAAAQCGSRRGSALVVTHADAGQ